MRTTLKMLDLCRLVIDLEFHSLQRYCRQEEGFTRTVLHSQEQEELALMPHSAGIENRGYILQSGMLELDVMPRDHGIFQVSSHLNSPKAFSRERNPS